MAKNEDNWMSNFEALKAHVAITGHFPDKHSTLNNWVRVPKEEDEGWDNAGGTETRLYRACGQSCFGTYGRKKKERL